MTASASVAAAADEGLAAAVGGDNAGAQAAIVIVSREPGAREILHRELSKRYGADYQILACDRPAELAAWMRGLRKAGLPVALVIGGIGGVQDRDGIEVLSAIRRIDPTALRVAAVSWGDWQSVRSIFDAVTVGTVDHWVTRPVQTVFVAGGGNSAGQTALHLAKWADRVTVLVRAKSLAGTMSDYLVRQIGTAPNVDVCYRVQVADGTGTGHLESLVLQDTPLRGTAQRPG